MIHPLGTVLRVLLRFGGTATSPSATLQYLSGTSWASSGVSVTAVATSRTDEWEFYVATSGRSDGDVIRIAAQATVSAATEYQSTTPRTLRNVPAVDSSGRTLLQPDQSQVTSLGAINSTALTAFGVMGGVYSAEGNTFPEFLQIIGKTDNLPASPAATGDIMTAAQTRTALGMSAADLDTQLAAILAASGSGGGATVYTAVAYSGPVPDDNSLPIVLYKGRKATIGPMTFTDYGGAITHGSSVTLRVLDKATYEDTSEPTIVALVESVATASLVDGTLTLTWELTAADTDDLPAGADGSGTTIYKMIAGSTTGNEYPVVDRDCVVRRYPATPA